MNESSLRQQMVSIARSFFNRGYATGSAGNLSVQLADGTILATPTVLASLTPKNCRT